MGIGTFSNGGNQMPTAEINMVPLIDVMLVLLIIFMITAPLMTHSVKVDLPRASSTPTPEKPMTLQVAITADNKVFIGSEPVDAATLETRFRDAVGQDANVELHLKA
ncbi:MAG: biopolymer transporter ExbD, partial [Dechloromonas sp.]|nr:biopolymer transporter ExbD [Dechloromonas sp.]